MVVFRFFVIPRLATLHFLTKTFGEAIEAKSAMTRSKATSMAVGKFLSAIDGDDRLIGRFTVPISAF